MPGVRRRGNVRNPTLAIPRVGHPAKADRRGASTSGQCRNLMSIAVSGFPGSCLGDADQVKNEEERHGERRNQAERQHRHGDHRSAARAEQRGRSAESDRRNQIQNSKTFSFAIQFFGTYQTPPNGPLGYMVIMLNGTYDLPNQGQYWALLVNGIYASAGIDLTFLKPSDKVEFVNEPYAAKHAGTAVEFRHKIHQQS